MSRKLQTFVQLLLLALICIVTPERLAAQNVKRLVIVKVDGLSEEFLDRHINNRNTPNGTSRLPWIEEIFYRRGTRLTNFYTRGLTLSTPSWVLLDTGQHLQIKGNIEYSRYTERTYDYLRFIPYYYNYGMKRQVDMPGTEVLDSVQTPLLIDVFPYEKRYQSFQLLQRGTDWGVLTKGFVKLFPREPLLLLDEWTLGFDFLNMSVNQNERDIVRWLESRPEIDYFDLYTADFDHVSHLDNSDEVRFQSLKRLDYTLGMIWTAIQRSSRADETALIVVSDHGLNSVPTSYSQGFNLVEVLQSIEGGGHHVVTKLRPRLEYKIKGLNPFDTPYINVSEESPYLKGLSKEYPTAKLDMDGNERASLSLRDNRLNILQILLQQLQNGKLSKTVRVAAEKEFFRQIEMRRADWQRSYQKLSAELDALQRHINKNQAEIERQPKNFTPEQFAKGIDKEARRLQAQTAQDFRDQSELTEYLRVIANLLEIQPSKFTAEKLKISNYIPEKALGELNSVYDLTNYVIRPSQSGLQIGADGNLDMEKSFDRINYFQLLKAQNVRSNVQKDVGNAPVDFIAVTISSEVINARLDDSLRSDDDPIWIYGSEDKQVLILTRRDARGQSSHRYLPIKHLSQNASGEINFEITTIADGFPLRYFEDRNLRVPTKWLNDWHTEEEWLDATHLTKYAAAIINIHEQLNTHETEMTSPEDADKTDKDKVLMRRFRLHQRTMTKSDLLILANDRWNFDVRGFNSGGNHGSFFRISANSVLMFAGGRKTKIPQGLTVEKPYDSLSFMPTVLSLLGEIDQENRPSEKLRQKGFRQFPSLPIKEIFNK